MEHALRLFTSNLKGFYFCLGQGCLVFVTQGEERVAPFSLMTWSPPGDEDLLFPVEQWVSHSIDGAMVGDVV
jgi:hypothetical protein